MDAETQQLPTCYRHPDRETRISCSSCDRPICVECMRSSSVGQKCDECSAPVGRSRVITASQLRQEGWRTAPFSYGTVAVCAVLFVIGFVVPGARTALFEALAQSNQLVAEGQLWRLLGAALLHASLWHVGFNMWALTVFGPPLEREVGTPAFASLYVAGALAGGATYFLLGSSGGFAVGASGAIFALFGAWLAASVRNRNTLQGRANLRQLLTLLGLNLALSFFPGIAWQAHVGGLVAGFAITAAWSRLGDGRKGRVQQTLVALGVGLLAVAAVLVV